MPDTSWAKYTSQPLLLPYTDLFMNTGGSGDHIPFTTSGLDFHCSTSSVSPQCVRAKGFSKNEDAEGVFCASICAHPRWASSKGAFVPMTLFSEGKHAPHPPSNPHPHFLSPAHPLPSLIHCSYWRQDMLASMLPALSESFFFIWIIMGLLGLEKYPAFVAF